MRSMYSKTKVNYGNYYSHQRNGVAQGSTLSPALFAIYTTPLISSLKNEGIWCQFYADDLIIMCNDVRSLKIGAEKV